MNFETLLREADPALEISIPDPEVLVARAISDGPTGRSCESPSISNLRTRPIIGVFSATRSKRSTALVVLSVAVVVAAAIAVPLMTRNSGSPSIDTPPTVSTPTQGTWALAGYITGADWQSSSSSGPLPTEQQNTLQLTCPTSSICYSSGTYIKNLRENSRSVISVTHAGGTSWQVSLAPDDGTYFFGFSCPSATTCMVAGEIPNKNAHPSLYTTTDGGVTWTTLPMPGLNEQPVLLSCESTLSCSSIGLEETIGEPTVVSYFTVDGGQNWSTSTLPQSFMPSGTDQSSLQCFSNGDCVAAGTEVSGETKQNLASMIYSANGGATWTSAATPTVAASGALLSCSAPSHCLSIESGADSRGFQTTIGVLVTSDAGLNWSALSSTGLASPRDATPMNFDSVSCATTSDCWASGQIYESTCEGSCPYVPVEAVMMATTDGGATWTNESLPAPPIASLQYVGDYPVDCVSDTDCRTVGTLELTEVASEAGLAWVQQDVVLTLTSNGAPGASGAPGSSDVKS